MRCLTLCAALWGALAAGCSPALDWREVRPEGSGAQALFPCKPKSHSRPVRLGGATVTMTMVACDIEGMTFALGHADIGDPAQVGAALAGLRQALADNLRTSEERALPLTVPGATPNPQAARVWIRGALPDGSAMTEQAGFFVRGTRVYQVAVLGVALDEEAVAVFFDSLRLPG